MIELKQAKTTGDFEAIEQMANVVMPEVYRELIQPKDIELFLHNYQTVAAITRQVSQENYAYYLIYFEAKLAGYVGIQLNKDYIHLSKLYVLKEFRGNKLGKAGLDLINGIAQEQKKRYIDLFVHIENKGSIAVYQKAGYAITETLDNTYGEGYIEKEYRMVKTFA
jgi:ribosomal protein S18 acetylase RimI-like enzyme